MSRNKENFRQKMLDFLRDEGIKINEIKLKNRVLKAVIMSYVGRISHRPGCILKKDVIEIMEAPRRKLPKVKLKVVQGSSFYDSDAWRELRYRALKTHGGCCQCCGARGIRGKPLHVDHIKPRSRHPELELELSNLQVLCADCNLGKRAWDETDWRTA